MQKQRSVGMVTGRHFSIKYSTLWMKTQNSSLITNNAGFSVIHITKTQMKTLVFCSTKSKFSFQLDITFYNFIDFEVNSDYCYLLVALTGWTYSLLKSRFPFPFKPSQPPDCYFMLLCLVRRCCAPSSNLDGILVISETREQLCKKTAFTYTWFTLCFLLFLNSILKSCL